MAINRARAKKVAGISALLALMFALMLNVSSAAPLQNTCSLFGGSSFASPWLSINILVILISFLAVALVYAASKLFSTALHSRIVGMLKSEVTQLVISIVIIAVLVAFSGVACNITASMSSSMVGTQSSLQPIPYAEYYIGNLSTNTGLKLLTYLYTVSISYTVDSQVLSKASEAFNSNLLTLDLLPVSASINEGADLGIPYSLTADFYIDVFSPIVTIAIGALFIQWLALPVIAAVAFTVVLPVALIVRSIAYSGAGSYGLRQAANAAIAICIAVYIIYPLTIALDSSITNWIFSQQNPSYMYLNSVLTFTTIPSSSFFSALGNATKLSNANLPSNIGKTEISSILSKSQSLGLKSLFEPWTVPQQAQYIINSVSQFLFVSIILFALNMAITLAFAQSLARALNSGLEGSNPFWSSL